MVALDKNKKKKSKPESRVSVAEKIELHYILKTLTFSLSVIITAAGKNCDILTLLLKADLLLKRTC